MAFLLSMFTIPTTMLYSVGATICTSMATQLVCCFSSAACHCCSKTLTPASSMATRAAYAAFFLLISIFAWTTQAGWIDSLFHEIPGIDYQCPTGRCSGPFAVLRVMFALFVFHILMAILTIGVSTSSNPRAGVQNGWWGVKIGVWLILTVIAFVIPNEFFTYFGDVSFVGAVLFLLIQLVLLLDFAASWSESWIGKYEESESKLWMVLLIASVSLMMIASVVLSILLYVFFCTGGCGLNIFFVTFNLVLGLIACVLSIHPKIQEAKPSSGLLQAAMVVLYMTYLITSAISDEVNDETEGGFHCNPLASSSAQQASAVFGTIFTFVVIAFSTTRAAAKSKILMSNEVPPTESAVEQQQELRSVVVDTPPPAQPEIATTSTDAHIPSPLIAQPAAEAPTKITTDDLNDNLTPKLDKGARKRALEAAVEAGAMPASALKETEVEHDEEDEKDNLLSKDDEKDGTHYNYAFFHVIFGMAAMYIAMLLTDWNTADPETGNLVNVGHDWVTVWVKVVSSWVAFALYFWTLIAPIVLPDRDWN